MEKETYLIGVAIAVAIVGASVYFLKRKKEKKHNKSQVSDVSAALSPVDIKPATTGYQKGTLLSKTSLSSDVAIFVFQLENGVKLKLPVGKHVLVKGEVNGRSTSRPYTPIDEAEIESNFVSLLIRKYDYGKMSSLIHNLSVGDHLSLRGPIGRYQHDDNCKMFVFISAGTGITPIYQVLRYILKQEAFDGKCALFFQYRAPEDILLGKELSEIQEERKSQILNFSFHLSRASESEIESLSPSLSPSPSFFRPGYIKASHISELLSLSPSPSSSSSSSSSSFSGDVSDVKFLVCGPSGFTKYVKEQLAIVGCQGPNVHVF